MKQQSVLIAVSVGALSFLLLIAYLLLNGTADYSELTRIKPDDHIKWSKEKKHILIVYSDLQCPACKTFEEMFQTWEASNSPDFAITQKVTFVYRHFPLYQIHAQAFPAAYAVESASQQGKFFKMLSAVFTKQQELETTKNINQLMGAIAKQIGLDTEKLVSDMNSESVKNKVQNDLASAEKAGINSTPTFFLNGKKLNPMIPNDLKAQLQSLE